MDEKRKYYYTGERYSHNSRRCTIVDTVNEWVEGVYMSTSVIVKYDDDESVVDIKPAELVNDLQFFRSCSGYSRGYSYCKVYGVTKEELIETVKKVKDWEYIFLNGQEEIDCLSFSASRMLPDEVVDMFRKNKNAVVFAWWHWDGDIFEATDMNTLTCEFTRGPEPGDKVDWWLAQMKLSTPDGKYIEIGAGDFSEDEITWYEEL